VDQKLEAAREQRRNRQPAGQVTDETDYFQLADNLKVIAWRLESHNECSHLSANDTGQRIPEL
jgi:hypothetical protein